MHAESSPVEIESIRSAIGGNNPRLEVLRTRLLRHVEGVVEGFDIHDGLPLLCTSEEVITWGRGHHDCDLLCPDRVRKQGERPTNERTQKIPKRPWYGFMLLCAVR